jgi:hypothetical protein
MPSLFIDNQLVEFPESCLAKQPLKRFREQQIVTAALQFPPNGQRGVNRYDSMVLHLAEMGQAETHDSVRSVLTRVRRRVRKWKADQTLVTANIAQQIIGGPAVSADDLFARWIGFTKLDDEPQAPVSQRRQVFVLADLHGYPHSFLLPAVQQAARHDLTKHFIYAGDLYDIFCSSGVGMKDGAPMGAAEFGEERYRGETAALSGFLKGLHHQVPGSYHHILRGNHDEIRKLFPKAPFWAVREFVKDPLQSLAAQFYNTTVDGWNVRFVESNGEVVEDYKHVPYALVFGEDLFISHLNKTGGKPMKSVNQTWGWIQAKRLVHDLGGIRCVLQAHSHKLSMQDVQGGHVRLVEIGFGGDWQTLKYQVGYNVWASETSVGCVVLEQYMDDHGKWHTDLNTIRHLRP